jgi:phosphatidate cytidylyltransferase
MVCVLWLHQLNPATGMWNLLSAAQLVVLPIWAGDIAGIVVGRRFGKRLLWPSISPSKTWVGAAANFAAASLITVGLGQALGLPADTVALACFATGILGQLGDLFESNLKRMAGLKDSGNLLPGHGGLMDRIDSILFTAPAMALLLHFTQN